MIREFKQVLEENGYTRQEELAFADCDRSKRIRVGALLSKIAAFAGYDYDARGLTHEKLYAMREVFLLSRIALRIHRCPRYRELLTIPGLEITASGGIARMEELETLQAMHCHAAILGKSIYTGAIDLAEAVRRYQD